MTETDATIRPLSMPEKFEPYLEKYRLYLLFKDIMRELILNLPKDHLKFMKVYLNRHVLANREPDRIMLLVTPGLRVDKKRLAKDLIKAIGLFVITRRCVMDRYEKHDDYEPGCISPVLMSEVTKMLTLKDPVPMTGWLMFDHPCTVREARCLQQDGVLPSVTLLLSPPPAQAPATDKPHTPARVFFDQDFEGLKYAYKATLKEVYIESTDDPEKIMRKCFDAVTASVAGLQGPGQGHAVVGAPGVYRVLLIGPRGAGCRTQGTMLAKHFGLVELQFQSLYNEALGKQDDIGEKLRSYGSTVQLKIEIVKRRLLQKDCIDHGWVLTGYPNNGIDFENLDNLSTPPNRVIFLNADIDTCKNRLLSQGIDWCTGRPAVPGSGPRVYYHPRDFEENIEYELDTYFSEALAEMRAAAGITAVEVDARDAMDKIQVKIQAAVIASPSFDISVGARLRNVRVD
ncbi:adenylate kinase 8 isoform X1 [Amyelois transitella]|uniref:adenylate kinase 8 isoform X1 n=2 Tax=Amyelois transitella TaxID=680683 RepID=UPI00299004B8|nr:adenylate kinase 8 isoform X1 [Amyelois transitella]